MKQKSWQWTDPAEAAVLDNLVVRLVTAEETARWDQLVTEHHYLQNAHLVGEQLRYVAEYQGQWLALVGWSAAAYHLKHRDQWIGWTVNQRRARLHFLANNARFCVLDASGPYPNLASRVLALNCERLSQDWLATYGHPLELVESFVDPERTRGTAYKASGWKLLDATAGFSRVAEDFYIAHDRPKQLYVRALTKHAERKLRARDLPAALQPYERSIQPSCQMANPEMRSLWESLHQQLPESRDPHGRRHLQATVLTIVFAYLLSGGEGGHRAVMLFAQDLSPTQRAAVHCYFNRRTRCYDVPSENCFYRVLKQVDVLAFQQVVWAWQKARLGGGDGDVVVLDGKALRGSKGTQLVGAINAQSGRTLGVETVADKSNEIPAGRTLLDRLDLDGTIALMDALHTQVETARTIVQECGGDYVLIVKANQSGLLAQAQHFLPEDFSPSTPHGGNGPRTH
jgi:hypothetical protein